MVQDHNLWLAVCFATYQAAEIHPEIRAALL